MRPGQLKALSRLFHRRFPALSGFTVDQAREIALLSADMGRQIGLLISRKGIPELVVVGDAHRLVIPELARIRQAGSRLAGVRLLHTHLTDHLLSEEDLMDMVFLRLDAVTVLTVSPEGEPRQAQTAHLLPPGAAEGASRVLEPTRWDQHAVDLAAIVAGVEEELARAGAQVAAQVSAERAVLVHVGPMPRAEAEASLAELAELCRTAGLTVAGRVIQRTPAVNPRSILGKGKLAEVEVLALQHEAGVLVFDTELTASQQRNLCELTERKVLDRTQVILDIFAQRARSREGKLQVELAQLRYTLPRLIQQNRALSRLAGGIGGRGPGETRLELDRRKVRDRMAVIRRELDAVRAHRRVTRSRRERQGLPVVSLVGYTNAGKSTLLNALTGSQVLAEDKLFATLDPTSRLLRVPRLQGVVLTDTVGFIRRLPDDLREAFMATLEELATADLLLHVADAASLELDEQVAAVEGILEELRLQETPRLLVLNKVDLLDAAARDHLALRFPEAVLVSARHGQGLEALVEQVGARLGRMHCL